VDRQVVLPSICIEVARDHCRELQTMNESLEGTIVRDSLSLLDSLIQRYAVTRLTMALIQL
jgi:hypothetical protein